MNKLLLVVILLGGVGAFLLTSPFSEKKAEPTADSYFEGSEILSELEVMSEDQEEESELQNDIYEEQDSEGQIDSEDESEDLVEDTEPEEENMEGSEDL